MPTISFSHSLIFQIAARAKLSSKSIVNYFQARSFLFLFMQKYAFQRIASRSFLESRVSRAYLYYKNNLTLNSNLSAFKSSISQIKANPYFILFAFLPQK
jgi:hypothetical protein